MKLVLAAVVVMAGCAGPMEQEPFVLPAEEREAALRYADEVPFTWDAPPWRLAGEDPELQLAEAESGYGGHVLEQPFRIVLDASGIERAEPLPGRLVVLVKAGADETRVVAAAEARWCMTFDSCREPTFPIVVPYSVLEQRAVLGWLAASPLGKYTWPETFVSFVLPGFVGVANVEVQPEVLDAAREVLERGGVPADAYRLKPARAYEPTTGLTAPTGG